MPEHGGDRSWTRDLFTTTIAAIDAQIAHIRPLAALGWVNDDDDRASEDFYNCCLAVACILVYESTSVIYVITIL